MLNKIKKELENIEHVTSGRMDKLKDNDTLVVFMKYNLSQEQRYGVLNKVIEVGKSNNYPKHTTTHWGSNWVEVVY